MPSAISSLIPVVHRLSWKVRPSWVPEHEREDLAQEGVVGLLEAAARYDPGHGCSLKTFGGRRAVGAMLDHARGVASRLAREEVADTPALDRAPRPDTLSPESRVMLSRFRRFLRTAWEALEGRDREIVRMRYVEGRSVRETALALGLSGATVCRDEHRVLDRLREAFLRDQRKV